MDPSMAAPKWGLNRHRGGGARKIYIRLSDRGHEIVDRLAARHGGNRSRVIQELVAEAAEREGLTELPDRQEKSA
jgi:hypothetical protein